MWHFDAVSQRGVGKALNEDAMLLGRRIVQGTGRSVGMADIRAAFAVADGVGGGALPHKASSRLLEALDQLMGAGATASGCDETSMRRLADRYAELEPKGMAATLVGVCMSDAVATVFNVGDSRAYLARRQHGLIRLSRDHTVAAEMADAQELTIDQADEACGLLKSLTSQFVSDSDVDARMVQAHVSTTATFPGDRLVLCSDGLVECMTDHQLSVLLRRVGMNAPQLVHEARRAGAVDDISVIVLSRSG